MACLFGHKWKGCKCGKCGETQNMNHTFTPDSSRKTLLCSVCGIEAVNLSNYNEEQVNNIKLVISSVITNSKNIGLKNFATTEVPLKALELHVF